MFSGSPFQLVLLGSTPRYWSLSWDRYCLRSTCCSTNLLKGSGGRLTTRRHPAKLPFADYPRYLSRSSGLSPVVAAAGGSGGDDQGGSRGDKGGGPGDEESFPEDGHTPQFVKFATWFFAALVTGGGVLGYIKKGSKPSLAAGITFGSIMSACAVGMGSSRLPILIALTSAAALLYVMGRRYLNSRKLMPAGVTAGASLLMMGLYTWALL